MQFIKSNDQQLFNCSPTYYAYYRGINYGMVDNITLGYTHSTSNAINTMIEPDSAIYSFHWSDNTGWAAFPVEMYLYSETGGIQSNVDYFNFRGMNENGIIEELTTFNAKMEISNDGKYAKITFPNYYGIAGFYITSAGSNMKMKWTFINKLINIDPNKWMKGYFEQLNTVESGTLNLGNGWLERLNESTIKIATDKGWTVSA